MPWTAKPGNGHGGAAQCRACAASLDSGRLDGLCPACTWKMVMEPDATPDPHEQPSLLAIPGHLVVEEVGRGGMGVVYRALQLEPARTVALKTLLPHQFNSGEMRERFRLEARAVASLDHPAILPVYQVGDEEGLLFYTMKYAAGGTLATRRDQYRGQFRAIAELMAMLAAAIQFAHEHGILHRDLKPGNILFDDVGRPYVGDFGLAKFVDADSGLTRSEQFLGTPHYLAPEVALRCPRFATTSSDVYSLGAILYELLSGGPPFEAEGVPALLRKIAESEPAGLASAPRDLAVICLKCLAKQPERRYASAGNLAQDLRRWLNGESILARPATRLNRAWRWIKRNPPAAFLASLLFIALAAGGVALVSFNLELRATLRESVLTQARLERTSGRVGQRFQALALAERAAAMLPAAQPEDTGQQVALRAEIAGALALADLRPFARWPVHVSHWGSAVEFTPDLEQYAVPTPSGGFQVLSTRDHHVLRTFPGEPRTPAVQFRFGKGGQWVAATFEDGHAELYAPQSGQPVKVFPGQPDVHTEVEFLPGEAGVLVSGYRRGLTLYGLTDAKRRQLIAPPSTVRAFKLSPNGESVAASGPAAVEVRRVRDGQLAWRLPFAGRIGRPAWSPDGRLLAVADGAEPYETRVFEIATGREVAHHQDRDLMASRLAFHPDGQSLASVGWDNRLIWRQLSQGGMKLTGQAGSHVLRFSDDGRRLAYEPGQGEVGLLEVTPSLVFHEWRRTTPPDEASCMIDMSPDGHLVATSSVRGIQLWDAEAREQIDGIALPKRVPYVIVLFHPDGKSLFYSALGVGVVQVQLSRREDLGPGGPAVQFGYARRLGTGTNLMLQEFTPDGRSLIVGEARGRESAGLRIWSWPDADPARAAPVADGSPMVGYHLTRDGRWAVASFLSDPDVWVWDTRTGLRARRLGVKGTASAEPTPDGRWVYVATADRHQLWDTHTWQPGPAWSMHSQQRTNWAVAFSGDGHLVATPALEGRLEIRSLPEARLLMELPPPQPLRLHDMKFSRDHRRLLLWQATGRLLEWDLAELRRELAKRKLDWRD